MDVQRRRSSFSESGRDAIASDRGDNVLRCEVAGLRMWLLRQREAYAQHQAGPRGEAAINAFVRGTATALEELLQRVATPLHFRHFGWNPAIERRLAPGAFPREGPKGWGRLVEGGFWGDVLPNPDVPFEEWTELIPRLGDVIVAARAMSRM